MTGKFIPGHPSCWRSYPDQRLSYSREFASLRRQPGRGSLVVVVLELADAPRMNEWWMESRTWMACEAQAVGSSLPRLRRRRWRCCGVPLPRSPANGYRLAEPLQQGHLRRSVAATEAARRSPTRRSGPTAGPTAWSGGSQLAGKLILLPFAQHVGSHARLDPH
jgi:hypothetical protein